MIGGGVWQALRRIFTTVYDPQPESREFLTRAQSHTTPVAKITAAVLSAGESQKLFGVPLARRGIQPVYLQIANLHANPLRLYFLEIDPHYFTPLEAAGINHFSIIKRLSAFGVAAWYFLPLIFLLPLKLLTASWANRRMDECFRGQAFPLRPIPPGTTQAGFIFCTLDAGTKNIRVCLYETGGAGTEDGPANLANLGQAPAEPMADVCFALPVPGMKADYHRRDFAQLYGESELIECDLTELTRRLRELPPATTNKAGNKGGDPVNLVVLGELETVLGAFTARWDECETITLETCWKTAKAFLLGAEYRYSPVSALYLLGRSQDLALQRIRGTINERLHLRLWLAPLRYRGTPIWVGQISRDIGVRFTTQTWNLTTHRVDPNVDESRDYLVEDLLRAERIDAVGYVTGVGACDPQSPRHNLTGDPYFTDGKRAVIALSTARTQPRYVAWS
ncbi:MAG: LssY C-terminal domain-containing protein [Pirellulales bacterium]|nr:LssY C-terminal domain-containing protein [Pirellulales bacterium]